MNYELKISGDSAEELLDVMQTLKAGRATTVVSRPVKNKTKSDPEPGQEGEADTDFTEEVPETKDDTAGDEKFTVEQVRKEVTAKINGNSDTKEKVKGLLKKHGADSVSALESAKYSQFLKDLKAL